MEYKVIISDSPGGLENLVRNEIGGGFKPLGGVSISVITIQTQQGNIEAQHRTLFAQAMTKGQ